MSDYSAGPPAVHEEESPLAGSVKPYRRHLAVCTGGPRELWAARVEEMEGLFSTLHRALRERGLHKQVKLTACDEASAGAEGLDVLLLPDMLRLPEVTAEKAEALAAALASEREPPLAARPLPPGDHIFVCVHANRDARCGVHGPRFYEALRREVAARGIAAHVHRTSHIGGHRFAAVCILYPEGIWYGNLRPEDAPRLVEEHLRHRRLLPEHFRGRMATSSCHQVAEAEAARVLARAYPEYENLRVAVEEAGGRATARASATVRDAGSPATVWAEFTLSCPAVWWTADDEPVFATDL